MVVKNGLSNRDWTCFDDLLVKANIEQLVAMRTNVGIAIIKRGKR